MSKILGQILAQYYETGKVSKNLVERAKNYDRKHPMWTCFASDVERAAWTIVNNPDLHR